MEIKDSNDENDRLSLKHEGKGFDFGKERNVSRCFLRLVSQLGVGTLYLQLPDIQGNLTCRSHRSQSLTE